MANLEEHRNRLVEEIEHQRKAVDARAVSYKGAYISARVILIVLSAMVRLNQT